jgi:predicted metal-dependent HD superfamily phosphohydrolase
MSDMTRYILTDDGNTEMDDEGYLVYYTSAVAALAAAEQRIVAMQQVLDTLGAKENVPLLIELAIEANDLMYANGQRDEAAKHHANQCCRICDTHVNPHRGCILR